MVSLHKERAQEEASKLDQNERFARLVYDMRQTEGMLNGGNVVPYFTILTEEFHPGTEHERLWLQLNLAGSYPLRRVGIRVVDYRKYKEKCYSNTAESPGTLLDNEASKTMILDDIPIGGMVVRNDIGVNMSPSFDKNYNIEIVSLMGSWIENLRFRKVDGHWKSAIRIFRVVDRYSDDRTMREVRADEQQVVTEMIDVGFPMVNGRIDWDE
jgi:hypothetical protein